VKDFVEECRREWKRLRVPDSVATEMAAELAADLEEAEAEGVPAEEVLGSGASDPRLFAAAWAAERAVGRLSPSSGSVANRALIFAALAALVAVAVSGAVLMIVASPSGTWHLASTSGPPLARFAVTKTDSTWVVAIPSAAPAPVAGVSVTGTNDSGADTRTVGMVLLIVGLAGIVLSMLSWLWARLRTRA
jgi:hypothetical protein